MNNPWFYYQRSQLLIISFFVFFIMIFSGCGSSGGNGGSGSNSGEYDNGSVNSNNADTGAATIIWDAPVTNEDGSALTDLAGYKIYYGTSANYFPETVDVGNNTGAVINGLQVGTTYYFVITAYNTARYESDYSDVVSVYIEG